MENKYTIIDTHAHYDSSEFNEDRAEVLNQINENGVKAILNCASSYKSIGETNSLTKEYGFVYGALGIHPENADEYNDEVKNEIITYVNGNKDKILAIGEIGLDYYWEENPPRNIQKETFRKQMQLAKELDLPVIIHDREAHGDTLEILKEFEGVRGIVHCFSGSVEMAKECIKLGYYIGITGVVTFKNARKVVEVVQAVPLEKLLVETDAPYMAPTPYRGKRNKSDYIEHIIEQIAHIKGVESLKVNLTLNSNFENLINRKF